MNKLYSLIVMTLVLPLWLSAAVSSEAFAILDENNPAMAPIIKLANAGDTQKAAEQLLKYFRERPRVVNPLFNPDSVSISAEEQKWADDALEHRFFVHSGYQPSYFYGKDIDWKYWPVKDNELRWQLHRTKWWLPMGKAYLLTKDRKYSKEWTYEYMDWIVKNPLDAPLMGDDNPMSSGELSAEADNVRFAWRPLEVSDRLVNQIAQFECFIDSPEFTPEFLTQFLVNYNRHADHITKNFSKQGNHLLFEAQRLIFAGVFFPELKDATSWRAKGVDILSREIAIQVYNDGMQFELDPHYHLEAINIFFLALEVMDANGYRNDFPAEYLTTIEKMIVVALNITFPDYTTPLFSDNRAHDPKEILENFVVWSKVFPNNKAIEFFATNFKAGKIDNLSQAFKTSGFYTLRNGWDNTSTVMIVKAGPPAFWHNQPDNGTFELWHKGRNFFPDSGCYVYGGDTEIMKERNWFRRTDVHNTLTLNNRNITGMNSRCLAFGSAAGYDYVATENPSYDSLTHRRAIFMTDDDAIVILDQAIGKSQGKVALHYNFAQGEIKVDKNSVSTSFDDGNNASVYLFSDSPSKISQRKGWISPTYRSRFPREVIDFSTDKKDNIVQFVTVIDLSGKQRTISAAPIAAYNPDGADVKVSIDNKTYNLNIKY